MNTSEKEVAWSLYWSQDRLHSCVASDNEQDQQVLNRVWADFANSLPDQANLLDLATGNGAVPSALLAARSDLRIEAVDQADIDPLKFLSGNETLSKVQFHGNTDIMDLPFKAARFDAITSQFGIEYAGLHAATLRAEALVKSGGKILFLIHHQQSSLIHDSKEKLEELRQITVADGLLDSMQLFLNNGYDMSKLNTAGELFLQGEFVRSAAISGQLFEGIEQVINTVSRDEKRAKLLAMSMDLRIRAEQQRLEQMVDSSHSAQSLAELSGLLTERGIGVEFEPVLIKDQTPEYLLCWKLSGEKE